MAMALMAAAGVFSLSCRGPSEPADAQRQATHGRLVDLLELVRLSDPGADIREGQCRQAIEDRQGTVREYGFDGQGGTEGWTVPDGGARLEAVDGHLRVAAPGGEARIVLRPEVDCSAAQRIRLRLRLPGGEGEAECRLLWSGGSLHFPCKPDRFFHTYTMEVGEARDWAGRADLLTLHFSGVGGGVEVDFIRFEAGLSAEAENLLRARGGLPGSVELDEDYRPAMLVPSGETRTVSLVVPDDEPFLTFAAGVSRKGWVDGGNPVRFRVRVAGGFGFPRTIFDLTLDPVNEILHRVWQDQRLSLASYAGDQVRLTFSVEDLGEGRGTGTGEFALWANPMVEQAPAGRTSVLIVLVDTLRSDHLGCYGYPAPVTPGLDRWSRRGVLYGDVVSSSCWTAPAVASLFTGRHAFEHGVLSMEMLGLGSGFETLAERFDAEGYVTGAVSDNLLIVPENGFDQGFRSFKTKPWNSLSRGARGISDLGRSWLEVNGRRPFFLYLHYMDPHGDYEPEAPFRPDRVENGKPVRDFVEKGACGEVTRRRRADPDFRLSAAEQHRLVALYDAEIASTDFHIGRLLAWMERTGILETTLVVVLADHGEGFGEHGLYSHANTLHAEEVSLPLLIIPLPGAGRAMGLRQEETIRMVDLAPTIASLAGLSEGVDGAGAAGEVICEMSPYAARPDPPAPVPATRSVRLGSLKLIHDLSRDEYLLYDLENDPGELRNIFQRTDPRAAALLNRLVKLRQEAAGADLDRDPAVAGPDAIQLRQLEALGYLDQ